MKKTILIVDDEEVILTSLRDMLQVFKYDIQTASSGAEALDILSSIDVDLIIADINMPKIDGKKILTAVKEIEPDTPIIIITGIDVEAGKTFAEDNNADGFLAKPIQIELLKELVEKLLSNK